MLISLTSLSHGIQSLSLAEDLDELDPAAGKSTQILQI